MGSNAEDDSGRPPILKMTLTPLNKLNDPLIVSIFGSLLREMVNLDIDIVLKKWESHTPVALLRTIYPPWQHAQVSAQYIAYYYV
jgi:hypothetical protein